MKKFRYLIVLIILIAQLSCEKTESFGEFEVSGKVWDDILQKPVSNLLVYMYDLECKDFACHRNKIVDSVRTDNYGSYKLKYNRKNKNVLYVTCGYENDMYASPSKHDVEFQFINEGIYPDKNFILRKTSVLRLKVLVKDNLYPPLRIHDNVNSHEVKVYGTTADTIVYLRGVANTINQIDLVVSSPDSKYFRSRTDYINLIGSTDTLNITINAEPDTFPIKKYY